IDQNPLDLVGQRSAFIDRPRGHHSFLPQRFRHQSLELECTMIFPEDRGLGCSVLVKHL
ncbi:Hypothetical protein FKW44_022631, partial [Caligus rogercresseyi]